MAIDAAGLFVAMAYNNAWANHRLHGAVARLAPGELAAPRSGFFPSIRATLNHILIVDWLYVDALERALAGQGANPDARSQFLHDDEPEHTAERLRAAQSRVDRRLIDLCESLDEAALDREVGITREDHVQREPVARVLAHLFQHQVHHRGQAHAMMSATTVPPPQLDEFFCAEEARLRADDFAALGFDEARVWRRSTP